MSSLVGLRVAATRRRKSSSCSWGISIWNDRISVMVVLAASACAATDLGREEVRLLPHREGVALVDPVDQVVSRPLRPEPAARVSTLAFPMLHRSDRICKVASR